MKILPVVLGVLALGTAFPAWTHMSGPVTQSNDLTDQILVKGGKEIAPEQIAGMRVVTWDDSAGVAKPFEVKMSGGSWIIPSHFDYPADGGQRVGKTAGGVLNIKRGRLVTSDPSQYEELGVIDPLDQTPGIKKGRGKRVTLTDQTGAVVVDLIIGNQASDGDGVYFVREADSKQVYTAKLRLDISTKFVDWVETDLLKVKKDDLRRIEIVDTAVDGDKGTINKRGDTILEHKPGAADWSDDAPPAGKRLSKDIVDKMVDKITSLKLVGIRPFSLQNLKQDGYFPTDEPQLLKEDNALLLGLGGREYALYSNEGRIDVIAKDGIIYSMVFGNVSVDDENADPGAAKKAAKDKASEGRNRFMTVFVRYNEAYDEEAKRAAEQAAFEAKESPKKEEDKASKVDKSAEIKKANQARARRLSSKFLKFFYVISDDSFTTMRPSIDKLFEDKPKEAMAGATGKTNKEWLEENGKKIGVTTTASGLEYQVLSSGPAGGRKPIATDSVSVNYKGTLVDGKVFDESKQPTTFNVSGVVKGWTEALQLMSVGDKYRLFLPPDIAYGAAGKAPIGPNEILIFDVELEKILTPPAAGTATPATPHVQAVQAQGAAAPEKSPAPVPAK
jgi:FKBP-type peptidyl-prolyl cis-trans isomerase